MTQFGLLTPINITHHLIYLYVLSVLAKYLHTTVWCLDWFYPIPKTKVDYDQYKNQKGIYENNMTRACALFWGNCLQKVKNKNKARSDFKVLIVNNPFELLKAIKEHSMDLQENSYNKSVILDSLRTLLAIK